METLEVGQRIELYKILTDGGFGVYKRVNPCTPGTIRPVIAQSRRKKPVWVDLLNNRPNAIPVTMIVPEEAIPIGAMIVKSLKFEPSY